MSASTLSIQGEGWGLKSVPTYYPALRSGIPKGAINAAWDAIGEVIFFLFISLMQEKRNQRVHYPQGPLDRGMQLTSGRDRPTSRFLRPFGSKRQSRALV